MRPSDLIDILKRLNFENGKAELQIDRHARDYIIGAVTARHGK
jgi:hypothetical protein